MPPTSVAQELAGARRPVAAEGAGGSRWSGRPQDDLPVPPERSGASFGAWVRSWLFWVVRLLPEVGEGCCCSSGGVEPSDGLLGCWRWSLGAWRGLLEGVEGSLRSESVSGLWVEELFVVEFTVCGRWPGWKLGVLGRWRFSESLGGVWREVAGWSGGNCEVGRCWVADWWQLASGGFSGWNGRGMRLGNGWVLGELGGVIGREMEV